MNVTCVTPPGEELDSAIGSLVPATAAAPVAKDPGLEISLGEPPEPPAAAALLAALAEAAAAAA